MSTTNNPSSSSDFECNICLDLAQDPIVTLCGHLFCWPCLYKWLHFHSPSPHSCPVCKSLIQEHKLVPLYGRGKNFTDPRPCPSPALDGGVHIPNRPSGQRPDTAPPPEPNAHFGHPNGFGLFGGLGGQPVGGTARFGNFALSASFGGLIPSLFNFQMHGFSDAVYGGAGHHGHGGGYYQQHPYGYAHGFHHGGHHNPQHVHRRHPAGQQDNYLKMLFLIIGVLVILTLISH